MGEDGVKYHYDRAHYAKSTIFGTEVHWTNKINLGRGPTKKVHIWRLCDVIFLEFLENDVTEAPNM